MRRSSSWFAIGFLALVAAEEAGADPHLLAADAELHGEAPLDFAALAVSSDGDLDGDGVDDLLIGAAGHDGAASNAGVVYVVFDPPAGEQWLQDAAASFLGGEAWEWAGADVDIAADVDGDGLDDMLVGAPGKDVSGGAYLVLGRVGGWWPATPLADSDGSFLGDGYGDSAGGALAGVGDVDGDGLGDLVIGARGNDEAGLEAGAAYLIRGRQAGWAPGAPLADADVTFTGEASGDNAGWDVAAAGDVNEDGLGDFLIGAPESDLGGMASGAAYLILGGGQGWSAVTDLGTADAVFPGEAEWQWAGSRVAGAGDVDGDGLDDLLVSADEWGGEETASLFLGTSYGWASGVTLADADVTFVADDGWELADVVLGGGGDVNGDGLDDIIVGGTVFPDPGESGYGAAVVPGDPALTPGFHALGTGANLVTTDVGVYEVWDVTARGDLDGDGLGDLVVGVRDGTYQGTALVVYGFAGEDADGDGIDVWHADCADADPQVYPAAPDFCGDQLDADCGDDLQLEIDGDGDGFPPCAGDCDDDNALVYPGAPELCGGVDSDCDGVPSPAAVIDLDGDGYSECAGDCDDSDAGLNPAAVEQCDGVDNDCDGILPEDELDADGDGFLGCEDCDDDDPAAYPGADDPCGDMLDTDCAGDLDRELDNDGDGYSPCQGDCHDNEPAWYPGAPEICNQLDDDCDGVLPTPEADLDGDGWAICEGDCNDNNPDIHPGTWDTCGDGVDMDCKGGDDEADADGDGWMSCEGDCDDGDPIIYPGAPEQCDGRDNNCNGQAGLAEVDGDGDGYLECEDCDDDDPGRHPGAIEICDWIDNDCDGLIDEPDPMCGGDGWDGLPGLDPAEGDGCRCTESRPGEPGASGWPLLAAVMWLVGRRRNRGQSVSMSR